MKWMFPKYEKNITQLANKCAHEIDMSPQWLRQKLSKWNSMTEVPIEDNFIQTLLVVSAAMERSLWSLLDEDMDDDIAEKLMAYQLGLSEQQVQDLHDRWRI